MKTEIDARTYSQAATALGISPARFSWLMKRKGFEGPKGPRKSRLVTREDIQRIIGRSIPDAAWESVRDLKAKPSNAEQHRRAAAKAQATLHDQLASFDPGWVAAAIRERDKAWERAALAQGVEIKAPAFPDDFLPILGAQHIYTQADVAELVAVALVRRDDAWRGWNASSQERALHPNGPPVIGSPEFFSPKAAQRLAAVAQPIIDQSCEQGASDGYSR